MADVKKLAPFLKKWEGGFVNDPVDRGGATNAGVTLETYKAYCRRKGKAEPTVENLKNLTDVEWTDILKTMYWDKWRADEIRSQSVANILVDWVWGSGVYGIRRPQKLLGVTVDGVVGSETLAAVNARDPRELFDAIKTDRAAYLEEIIKARPANEKYRRGWFNRLNDMKFTD